MNGRKWTILFLSALTLTFAVRSSVNREKDELLKRLEELAGFYDGIWHGRLEECTHDDDMADAYCTTNNHK